MRAQRIKTGFHRLGLEVTVICLLPAILAFAQFAAGKDSDKLLDLAVLALVVGVVAYPAARTLAWIIAGFAGDKDSN